MFSRPMPLALETRRLGKNLGTLLFCRIKDATKIEMSRFVAKTSQFFIL